MTATALLALTARQLRVRYIAQRIATIVFDLETFAPVPCNCPPDRQAFIDVSELALSQPKFPKPFPHLPSQSLNANVAAGHDVNNPAVPAPFPADDSVGSQVS